MTRAGCIALIAIALCGLVPAAARSESLPLIRKIEFQGNETTRERTMLREILVGVGDPAEPSRIERSRQAIMDLGLFRSVKAEIAPVPDGVKLIFTVREKWPILPLPRVQGNSNGDYGYGGQLQWNNLWGLNQTFNAVVSRNSYQDADRTADESIQLGYSIPFVGEGRFGASGSLALISRDSINPQGQPYHESLQKAGLVGSYALSSQHPSTGWTIGGGLLWQRDAPEAPFAPTALNYALGPSASLSYNDLHYLTWSEEGTRFSVSSQAAVDGLAANYSFISASASFRRDWHIGNTPHQTFELRANTGAYLGGAEGHLHDFYVLGGQRSLRAYPSNFTQGDAGYYLAAAYLRPVATNSLRLIVIAEAGDALDNLHDIGSSRIYSSLGIGLRLRINWLVNVELEAGGAFALTAPHRFRAFAGNINESR